MTKTGISTYTIDALPFDRGAVLIKALENYDQRMLLHLTGRQEKIPAAQLLPIAEMAARDGIVQALQVRTPAGQVLRVVDLGTFQQEMDAFVQEMASHELIDALNGRKLETDYPASRLKECARTLVNRASANVFSLKVLELFCRSIDDFFRLARASVFPPIQVRAEFKALLQLLHERRPQHILEIGTANGGTLYLFTKIAADDAALVSVDLKIKNERLFSSFRRKHQQVLLKEGNSTDHRVRQELQAIFPNGLDFLFIDGDHSYEGVKEDFQNYFPYVKPGGMVAFHDIVESYDSRFGLLTVPWAGGVPQFWNEIKRDGEYRELVENRQQDGFGIGVLFKAR